MTSPYLEAAKRAIAQAERKAVGYKGPCSACKWQRPGAVFERCGNPIVQAVAFNVTDGYAKGRIQQCDEQRDTSSIFGPVVCGPDGELFEAIESPVGWLRRLLP